MYRRYLKTPKADQEDNDDAGVENIVIASYGRGYFTEDGRAREHHEDLLAIVDSMWGEGSAADSGHQRGTMTG